jgi:integral membrane protein
MMAVPQPEPVVRRAVRRGYGARVLDAVIGRFRVVALVESVSWIVMLGAVVAKRLGGVDGATTVVGPIHGVIFLVYLGCVLFLRGELGWDRRQTALAVGAALIPLGAHVVAGRLAGPAAGGHPGRHGERGGEPARR